jgi:site-specific recombinase XerC
MSRLVEIQEAVVHLPSNGRKALQVWLDSQVEPDLSAPEEQRLLRSLEEAVRDIDAGKGMALDDVRKRVGSWAAKKSFRRKLSRIWRRSPFHRRGKSRDRRAVGQCVD